jgi:hypothetical protein
MIQISILGGSYDKRSITAILRYRKLTALNLFLRSRCMNTKRQATLIIQPNESKAKQNEPC